LRQVQVERDSNNEAAMTEALAVMSAQPWRKRRW
jgi:hypothetical protein